MNNAIAVAAYPAAFAIAFYGGLASSLDFGSGLRMISLVIAEKSFWVTIQVKFVSFMYTSCLKTCFSTSAGFLTTIFISG